VFHHLFALPANTLIRRANCSPLQIFKHRTYFILWTVWLSYENLKRFLKRLTVGKGYDKLIYDTNNTSEKGKTQGGETVKLRNINRGLVLGGVLALGVVCYTVYDNNQFKTSKPEIEQTMRDYIADLTSANVGSSDKLKSQLTDFVNKHYADYTISDNEYASSKSGLLEEINQAEVAAQGGDITSAEYDIKEMSINKSGADGAKVIMIYNVCYDVSKGDPTFLTTSGINTMTSGNYTNADNYKPSTSSYKAIFSYEYAEFYLLRTSDGWKIATSSDYGYGEDYSFDDNNSDSVADESKAESEIVPDSSAENTNSEGADSVE